MSGFFRFLLGVANLILYVAVAAPHLSGAGLPGAPWQAEWWTGALAFLLTAADFSSNVLAVAARLVLGLLFAGVLSTMESRQSFLSALSAELALVGVWWLWPADAAWPWKIAAFLVSLLLWLQIVMTEMNGPTAPRDVLAAAGLPGWTVTAIALPIVGALAGPWWGYLAAFLGALAVAVARRRAEDKHTPLQRTPPPRSSIPTTPPPPAQAAIPATATATPTPPTAPAPAPDLSAVREEKRRELKEVIESKRRAEDVMQNDARRGWADPEVHRKHEAFKKQKADLESELQSLPPADA